MYLLEVERIVALSCWFLLVVVGACQCLSVFVGAWLLSVVPDGSPWSLMVFRDSCDLLRVVGSWLV